MLEIQKQKILYLLPGDYSRIIRTTTTTVIVRITVATAAKHYEGRDGIKSLFYAVGIFTIRKLRWAKMELYFPVT